jgi:hypothetical protein
VNECLDPRGEALGYGHGAVTEPDEHVDLALRGPVEGLGEEVALGGEVPVDAAGRHPGPASDGDHRGRGVAAFGELVERRGDDALPHGGGAGAGALGRAVGHGKN